MTYKLNVKVYIYICNKYEYMHFVYINQLNIYVCTRIQVHLHHI